MMMAISLRSRSKVSNNCSTTVGARPSNGSSSSQYPHVAGQRAGHRDHLLLAAGEVIGRAVEPLANSWKVFVDAFPRPVHAHALSAASGRQARDSAHAHPREQAAALRHVADAEPRICADELPISSLPASLIDPLAAGAMPIRVFSSVDLPAPLRPSSADDLVLMQRKIHVVEDVALAVEGIDMLDREQRIDAGGGLARTRGDFGGARADIDLLPTLGLARAILDQCRRAARCPRS